MKRTLLLLIGMVATALTAHAQRLLPRQTGVEITAGVPVIQNEKLIQPETFTVGVSFNRYLKAESYTFLSAVYERQNLTYEKSNVPLSDALLLAGYMHPLRIGRRGKSLTPNDRYAIAPGHFTLYYHSLSAERQSLEVVFEDNHGESQTLAFDFNSKEKDADSDYSLLSHPSRPFTGAAGSKASQ